MGVSFPHHPLVSRQRAWITITFLASTLLATMGAAAAAQAPPGVRDTTLTNGLRVMVLEDHSVALATVVVAVRNGAFTQQPGEQGIAHVYEHLLFRAYRGDPSKFAEDASDLRAAYNGETGQEVVYYYMILPSDKADKAIEQLARLVMLARFDEEDLSHERPVILDELARGASDPAGRLRRIEDRDLWGSDWYRKDVGGDSTSLKGVTLARLKEYFNRYYIPNNSALIVTGDVNTKDVFHWAHDRFGKWKRAADPFADEPPTPLAPLTRSSVVVSTSDAYEATIRIEVRGPGLDVDPDGVSAMSTLARILGRSGSPFIRDMVVNGPFRELECDFEKSRSAGTVVFRGSADLRRATEAATMLSFALDHLEGYLTQSGEAATKLQELDRALVLEVRPTLAPYMAELWARGETLKLDEKREAEQATSDELVRVARTYIQNKPRVIGAIVPAALADTVRVQIERKEGIQ